MIKYIKNSWEKFKDDALSSLFYDILKWLIPLTVLFVCSRFLPTIQDLDFFLVEYAVTLYQLLIVIIFCITATVVILQFLVRRKYRALEKDNFTDELTGLTNYKGLKKDLLNQISETSQSSNPLSLILLDIDNFKTFNSDHGYNIADKLLAKIGLILSNDRRITDRIYRQFLRGDEFLVIANKTSANDAYVAAERKRKLIQDTLFEVTNKSFQITVSCGITEYVNGDDYDSITARVNSALIQSKKNPSKNVSTVLV